VSKPRPRTESELVELVRSIDAPAPAALHGDVRALISARRPSARGRGRPAIARSSLTAATALAAVAAAVLAIALLSAGGGNRSASAIDLRDASALTLRPATAPAPRESPSNGAQLAAAVDGVSFPYWEERFGWRSTGTRSDSVGGRTVTTVFYSDGHHHRIGYAIVPGVPPQLSGGAIAWRGKVPYRLSSEDGALVVTWLRDGHLCVMSGRGVHGATLLQLASWGEHASPVPQERSTT
jgi:hypothetical protein